MKSTPDDEKFAADFGRELKRHYELATQASNLSDEQFAATLDVSRPALRKYLQGKATPCLRVIVLAFTQYGINVPYIGTPLFGTRAGRKSASASRQLILPFSVQASNADIIETSLDRKGPHAFEVRIRLNNTG